MVVFGRKHGETTMEYAARRCTSQIHRILITAAMVVTATFFAAPGLPQTLPVLPQTYLDTTYVPPTGRTIFVGAGGDLQAAINSAVPGDTIVLQAGATFTGNFTLPNKVGTGWIYIQSSAYSSLPAPGTRVSPAQASLMPKIVTPNGSPAIAAAFGAHQYRLIGIEVTTTISDTNSTQYGLIVLGYDYATSSAATSLAQLSSDVVFDRCYIHGTPTGNVQRGIAVNSRRTAVIDSYISDIHGVGFDTQAIGGWNGDGPFKIVNNYLEAAAENVLFGGADPSIANLVPSDIEIRRNHFFKPLSWKLDDPSYAGIPWTIKNLLELKNAKRVLLDGNVLEQSWANAQIGYAMVR